MRISWTSRAVMDAFAGSPVTPEEMEEVYSRLEKRGIKIQADEEETVHEADDRPPPGG